MSRERAYEICLEMIIQREYSIIDKDSENMTITALKPNGEQMLVLFNSVPTFGASSLKETINSMYDMSIKHCLVVYDEKVTSNAKNTIVQLQDIYIELFSIEELQYNITKHRLQPKFEKLNENEAKEFKEKYGTKFGTLRIDKPISRFYDYQRGDVICITRGYNVSYRIVRG